MRIPFQQLKIWEKGMRLTQDIYGIVCLFPKNEQYELGSQLRRCAVSVPSNIAEGSQRGSDKEFSRYILIAKGSLAEAVTQLLLARRLHYVSEDQVDAVLGHCEELNTMLFAFHRSLASAR